MTLDFHRLGGFLSIVTKYFARQVSNTRLVIVDGKPTPNNTALCVKTATAFK